MGKNVIIGGRIHNPEVGNVAVGANEVLDDTKVKKQNVINAETDAELLRLENEKQDNLSFDNTPTENSTNPITSGGVYASELLIHQAIEMILALIPSAASALNQLADKSFVNSTVATATATFRGTYNVVTDLGLEFDATHEQIAAALLSHIATADNNDYAFVQIPVSATSTDIRVTERYKFNGTAWAYEYDLNNSGFTALQWAAINSGITALLVEKLGALPTAAELATALAGKQATLTFDNVPTAGSNNPVKSGGLYELFTAINAKFPGNASADNKLVAEDRLAAYVAAIIGALDATFDLTSSDGHITFRMTQTNGVIASVQILTSDIASASALTTLGGQVSTNASDIAALQALYNALQRSAPQIIQPSDTWPVANPSTTVIYRVIDRVNTPPQYYSDYMWNGTAMVLMATYNNAIDAVPTAGSHNLVESGGVYEMAQSEGIYDILSATVINNNTEGTSGKTVGPIDYAVNIPIGSLVKIQLSELIKTGGGYVQVFAYNGNTRLEFVSLAGDDLKNGDYYITLSNNCDKIRVISYTDPSSSISCKIGLYSGIITEIKQALDTLDKEGLAFYPKLIQSDMVSTLLPDANDALENTFYQFASSNIPANMPNGITLGDSEILFTTKTYYIAGNKDWKWQYIFDSKINLMYWRHYNGTWGNWNENKREYMRYYPDIIVAENVNSILPDADNAAVNTLYRIQSSVVPSNFPNLFPQTGEFVFLETIATYYAQGGSYQYIQTIYDQNKRALWSRSYYGSWSDWVSIWHHIKVGQGSDYGYYKGWAFDKLYDAISFAAVNPNTEIEVFDGTYDLIDEMGDDWATNYYGIPLGSNMKIKFHENAYVTCHYTGDDQGKLTEFSAFAVIGGDFEIDGLKLSCSRIRYPIHDDNASNQSMHTHIYKNCEIIFDNTDNELWEAKQCIGGGFGQSTKVIIENCYFESVGADTTHPEVSYHNVGYGTSAKSSVMINNCYFKNSSCWFGYYGQTQLMSQARVSNCSMKWLPKVINETGDAPNVNIELKQWNNEIRL